MRGGDILALGTNEVPRAFGGQYWEGDTDDGRDYSQNADFTTRVAYEILSDILARLGRANWLRPERTGPVDELVDEAVRTGLLEPKPVCPRDPPSLADRALLLGLIEFKREMHAEMAALISAARRGVPVDQGLLFSTAFPCHECARHIVGAGIRRVYFIEPYPKSRVTEMYRDSIAIDHEDASRVSFRAFTGIAPRLYATVFEMPPRRDAFGNLLEWESSRGRALPRRRERTFGPGERDLLESLQRALDTTLRPDA